MKVKKEKVDEKIRITFIPETEEEKLIMGSLRNHYFFGDDETETYPKYDGITSKDKYVTSMSFVYSSFK